MMLVRFEENPLITPTDVSPSREGFEVVCAFNCGAVRIGDETLLLLRVAERPRHGDDEVVAPILSPEDITRGVTLLRVKRTDPDFEHLDSRVFSYKQRPYLTSMSHLRVARSKDGRNFTVDDTPAMIAEQRCEEYGVEDPRITEIDGVYYINYTAVSRYGVATALARTTDFKSFERLGVIFVPDNRDVTIFPEKIGGKYVCHHRPMAAMFARQDMWVSRSEDLIHWGEHAFLAGCRPGMWDAYKVGGGAVPIKTDRGWLSIYHGADEDQRYCLGALLTALDDPARVLARSEQPILVPETYYETKGFFGNVVFSCGAVVEANGRVVVYYGASDEHTCAAETTIDELLKSLE